MSIYTNKLELVNWNHISLPNAPKTLSSDDSIKKIAKQAFNNFSNTWNYVGKTLQLTRHILNIILHTPSWINSRYTHADKLIRNTITKLKLFSIVGVFLDVGFLPSKINAIWTNIQWKDNEGILLSTLSFTVMIADMFDSVTSFVNVTLNTLSLATVGWVAAISSPFTFSLIGLSLTLKAGNLYNITKFSKEFDRDIITKIQDKQLSSEELRSIILPMIHNHLGQNLDPIDTEHRTEITKRRTSSKILFELKELARMIENQSIRPEKIAYLITKIKKSLKEEMALQAGSLLTIVIAGIASTLFFTAAATTPLPFALLAISVSLRISLLAYQEWKASHKNIPST